jgi:HlyD family secretion protein
MISSHAANTFDGMSTATLARRGLARLPAPTPRLGLLLLVLGSVIGLTAFAATRALTSREPPPAQPAFPVLRGPISATVSTTGNVAAGRQAKLAFRTTGYIQSVEVSVGDQVTAGQTLATLGTDALRRKLEQAQSQLADARLKLQQSTNGQTQAERAAAQAAYDAAVAKLNDLRAGPTQVDIQAAEATVASALATAEQANAKLRALEGGGASAELAAAEASVESARNSVAAAEAKLTQLQAGTAEEDVTAARSAVQQAEATFRSAEAKLDQARAGGTRAELVAAQADDDVAQASLTEAKTKLEQVRATAALPTEVAAASAEVSAAAAKLHNAHQALDQTSSDLEKARANLAAQDAALAAAQHTADQTCDLKGDSSAECQAAKAEIESLRPQQLEATRAVKLLEGSNAWSVVGARKEVASAQEAYEAAQLKLQQAQTAARFPVDLASAQAAYDTAVARAESARAKIDQLKAGGQPADVIAAQSNVESARASLASARAKLQALEDGPKEADRVAAETTLETARANLLSAEAKLAAIQVSGPADLASARTAVRSGRAAVDSARATLAHVLEGPTAGEEAAAESAVAAALATLAKSEGDPTQIARDEETVRQAELTVEQAQAEFDDARLVAPFDGVVSAVSAAVGDPATGTSGSSNSGNIITLLDTGTTLVDVSLTEADASKTRAGQTATLTFDALPGQEFRATVKNLSPAGSSNNGVVSYPATLSVDSRGQFLPVGMTATVTITTAHKASALVVPNRMVRRVGDQAMVDVLDADSKPSTRLVRTGIVSDELTEIVDGLQENDQVLAPAPQGRTATAQSGGDEMFAGPPPGGKGGGPMIVQRGGP